MELASSSEILISAEAMLVCSGSFPESESESSSETAVLSEYVPGFSSYVCTCGVGDKIVESIESEELSILQAVPCSSEMPWARIHSGESVDTGTKEADSFVISTFLVFFYFFWDCIFMGIRTVQRKR